MIARTLSLLLFSLFLAAPAFAHDPCLPLMKDAMLAASGMGDPDPAVRAAWLENGKASYDAALAAFNGCEAALQSGPREQVGRGPRSRPEGF